MALAYKAIPFTFVVHALAVAGAVMVLVWCIHFRGGLAWEATNKSLIFNVSTVFPFYVSWSENLSFHSMFLFQFLV